jgi:hypothetical protein
MDDIIYQNPKQATARLYKKSTAKVEKLFQII